ncbi:MAG: class I SAM-dependent methyltransferase [Rhabdaerophilum sp.]
MSDWTSGYVAEIGYTYGYYSELNPLRIKLAFLHAGLAPPDISTACELGFGQGLSINIHAAATGVQWSGTDFNPAQAGFARELASAAGTSPRLEDASFEEFAALDGLPEFDFISLHGIWSWISDQNRDVIVDFIRRKLKVGGVVYVSYNTLPGWSHFAPMRHLMTEHAARAGSINQGVVGRIDSALDFLDKLSATNPATMRATPSMAERLTRVKGQNRNYLAHEYFNRDWHPMYFADMSEWMDDGKMTYACSGHLLDQVDAINLTPDQQTLLKGVGDAQLRETVRDFMVNQQFRRDYWVKGARRLSGLEQSEGLRAIRVMLVAKRQGISLKVTGALGEANLSEAVYGPLLDSLADYRPKTIGQVEQALRDKNIGLAQIIQSVMILSGSGTLALVQDDAAIAKARKASERINTHLLSKSRSTSDIGFLASPVTGGGVAVGRFNQLFLLALEQGQKSPAQWAQFTWSILAAQGQRIVKDGATIESAEENLVELTKQAQAFSDDVLPILKALQIA